MAFEKAYTTSRAANLGSFNSITETFNLSERVLSRDTVLSLTSKRKKITKPRSLT